MRKFVTACFVFAAAGAAFGQRSWEVDSSSVTFRIRNAGIVVKGSFTGLDARIDFNPRRPGDGMITASVDASTVDTGIRIRNNHLRKKEYFNVGAFPRITMTSRSIRKTTDGKFAGEFAINLKGRERMVTFPFSFQKEGQYSIFTGTFEINRIDYDIGGNSIILDDNVRVAIWVKAKEVSGHADSH